MTVKRSVDSTDLAHTTIEFIMSGEASDSCTQYRDFSYINTIDGQYEFVVKNTLDDYEYEIKEKAVIADLTSDEVLKYKYNPKLLAYDLYGSTKVYHVILRLNDMCDVHQFDLKSKSLKLLSRSDMADCLSSIYNADSKNIEAYNSNHLNDTSEEPIKPYK